jgi:NTP pyrophosphatase (non-canonical NTP hydrolase)
MPKTKIQTYKGYYVPTLEEAKKKIEELVVSKGFGNQKSEVPNKLLFAFIELGEASDAWKKAKPKEQIIEELIDVIFYVIDASRLIYPEANLDEFFEMKYRKNMSRPYRYGENFRDLP